MVFLERNNRKVDNASVGYLEEWIGNTGASYHMTDLLEGMKNVISCDMRVDGTGAG